MEMIFRFSGDGKLVHATGPPQAKIWEIVRVFVSNCTSILQCACGVVCDLFLVVRERDEKRKERERRDDDE